MCRLIPIKYHSKNYPTFIQCNIDETTGHFDAKPINPSRQYSLHTEYSYMPRRLDSRLLDGLDEIKSAHIKGIPQLWKNERWAEEFSKYIVRLIGNNTPLEIIEIHPPFIDYCKGFAKFFQIYEVFENAIKQAFPKTKIF